MRRLLAGLAGFGLLWALAGCADPGTRGLATGEAAATTTTAAPRPQAAPVKQRDSHFSGRQLNLAVYYQRTFKGRRYLAPEWHPVPYTRAVAAAAVSELLEGEPYCPGSRRPFPAGTGLAGLQVDNGTATVALSGAGLAALPARARRWPVQALVHTLTQFPTVQRVVVRAGGRAISGPLTRDRSLRLAPIALAEPAPGALVKRGPAGGQGRGQRVRGHGQPAPARRPRPGHGPGPRHRGQGRPRTGAVLGPAHLHPAGLPTSLDGGGLRGLGRGRRHRLLGPAPGVGGPLAATERRGLDIARRVGHDPRLT